MKIIIAAEIFPPDIAGPAVYASKLAGVLTEKGVEVNVLCYADKAGSEEHSTQHGQKYRLFQINRRLFFYAHYLVYFFKLLQISRKADLIYAQGLVSSGLPAILVAKILRKKYIVRTVGDYAWEQAVGQYRTGKGIEEFQKLSGSNLKIKLLNRIERLVAKKSAAVIVPTSYLKNIFAGWGVEAKKIFIARQKPEADLLVESSTVNELAVLIQFLPEILELPAQEEKVARTAAEEVEQGKKGAILVTGGAGFIGAYVAKELLAQGEEVIIVDNFNDYYAPSLKEDRIKFLVGDKAKLYRIDICDVEKLKKVFQENKISKICHLAAQAGVRYSIENPMAYLKSNVEGTVNLLELTKDFNIKNFVYASSSSVYGKTDKDFFAEMDKTDNPLSMYAASKKSCELMSRVYHNLYGINCAGLRFFTVYGPWGRPDMAPMKFTKAISEDKIIDVYNRGEMKRSFTYIDDIVSGILKVMDGNFAWEIFNLGMDDSVKLSYFIELLEKKLGKVARKNLLPMQDGDMKETGADFSHGAEKLGWTPKTHIEEGVERFVEWYKGYYK